MTVALKFYFPSNSEDQDEFMKGLWNRGVMSYLIYTRRMSLRGNPYIKGVFILNDEDTMVPSEFECIPLSEDCVPSLVNEFQEEILMENNGVKVGYLY